ncbi:MAG: hypothetical protein IIB38_17520 [Candidatus Hydrogenedentes bacterium]|nr:hypothetical protein [Candidatus Hydrogenedentota bacterium]
MSEGVSSGLRFLMGTWTGVALLAVAGCGSPVQDAEGAVEPAIASLKSMRAELVADVARVKPGEYFQVGVLFTIPDRSHIYWRNPGASGLPTGVEWKLAEGVEAGELLWPAPKRFEIEGWDGVSFGYESEVLLFTRVRAVDGMPNAQSLSIAARVYWLNCEEDGQCIPGDAELQLEIPVGAGPGSSLYASLFEGYRRRVPVPPNSETVPLSLEREEGASFRVRPRADTRIDFDSQGGAPDFFPDEGEAWSFERIPGTEAGSAESIRFMPPDSGAAASGVLKVPVRWEDSGAQQMFYISISMSE